jgi:hypothetical protein
VQEVGVIRQKIRIAAVVVLDAVVPVAPEEAVVINVAVVLTRAAVVVLMGAVHLRARGGAAVVIPV